jgi:hypothetical protein
MGGLPTSTGTVGTTPGPCVIGETCVPIPTYNSNGGTPLPVVEIPVLTYADAQAAGVKVEVSQGHPYVYFIGGAGGASANCSHRSGTNVDGEPWSGQDCIVGASGNHVGFFIPDSNPQYSCVYVLNLSNCS